ncbi:MAG: hypothetical protein K2H52_03330 [Lachnospiraceae bacterium]|nr:hypothetical protein [Lachnospiraceae bacterium]
MIKQRAFKELRKPSRSSKLIAFLPEAMGSTAYQHNGIGEFGRTWTSSTERAALRLKAYEDTAIHVLY